MHIWHCFLWRQITQCAMWQLCEHISSIIECEVSCIHFKFTSQMGSHQSQKCWDKMGLGQGGNQGVKLACWQSRGNDLFIARNGLYFRPMKPTAKIRGLTSLLHLSFQNSWRIWFSGKSYFPKQNMGYGKFSKAEVLLCSRRLLCPSAGEARK